MKTNHHRFLLVMKPYSKIIRKSLWKLDKHSLINVRKNNGYAMPFMRKTRWLLNKSELSLLVSPNKSKLSLLMSPNKSELLLLVSPR